MFRLMNLQYILPMAAMVLLTFVTGFIMFFRRIVASKAGDVNPLRFKTLAGEAPNYVVQAERHFINLFEVPVLFYAACIVAAFMPLQSSIGISVAWSFVCFRALQAIVHLWPNKMYIRMSLFLGGFVCVGILWGLIYYQIINPRQAMMIPRPNFPIVPSSQGVDPRPNGNSGTPFQQLGQRPPGGLNSFSPQKRNQNPPVKK